MNSKSSNHPLQSFEWGSFREKSGVKVVRENGLQVTIHRVPKTPWNIGYFPKGSLPNNKIIETLRKIGARENCIFIQLEPNIYKNDKRFNYKSLGLRLSAHPLFTKFTFLLDLTKSEDELLKAMHQKTRYNIRVAQKHGVEIIEDNSEEAFREYLRLTEETTARQGFYAHTKDYHQQMWNTLKTAQIDKEKLSAHLLMAKYNQKVLAAWILFVFKDTLYYPYGASSSENRETMSSNLMMWEAIKFGKKMGLKKFDMWGALGTEPDKNDPWYGFHRFKEGYGPKLVEFVGSYDLVIKPSLYNLYLIADKMRWFFLRLRKK